MQNIVKNVIDMRHVNNSDQMTVYLLTINCTIFPFWLHISEF